MAKKLEKSFYGEKLWDSDRIWLENAPRITRYKASPRINIQYAGEPWVSKQWRFYI